MFGFYNISFNHCPFIDYPLRNIILIIKIIVRTLIRVLRHSLIAFIHLKLSLRTELKGTFSLTYVSS